MKWALQRLALLALGLLLAAIVVESLLQVAAFAVWSGSRRTIDLVDGDVLRPGERVVLCIGDSNTFGAGASSASGSYPARLQELLRVDAEGGLRWTVLNHGWPGRNSAEVLDRLPRLLERIEPDYLLILVGVNNEWNDTMLDGAHP